MAYVVVIFIGGQCLFICPVGFCRCIADSNSWQFHIVALWAAAARLRLLPEAVCQRSFTDNLLESFPRILLELEFQITS